MHKNTSGKLLFLFFLPILKKVRKKAEKGLTIKELCSIIDKLTAESGANRSLKIEQQEISERTEKCRGISLRTH